METTFADSEKLCFFAQTKPQLNMKKVLFTALILCAAMTAFSQGRFSAGAEVVLPQGDWNDFVSTGFGVSVRYESPINENISWMGTAGYVMFGEKDDSGLKISMIPVMAGAKYYFNESFNGFYGGLEAGLVFAKSDVDGGDSESETEFGFAPQIGYHIANLDFSVRYTLLKVNDEDANSIGLRVAYVFGGE
jgi:hypothetical protein